MLTLIGRLLLWLLVWHAAQLFAPDGSRFAFYFVVALLPPTLAWAAEDLGSLGVGSRGPARSQIALLASIESLCAVIVVTVGMWIPPLLIPGLLVLCGCGAAATAWTFVGTLRIVPRDDGLHIRHGDVDVVYLWAALAVRRRGRTFSFQSNGKQLTGRFSPSRGEELRAAVQAHGVVFDDEPMQEPSLLPAFGIGLVAALLPVLLASR